MKDDEEQLSQYIFSPLFIYNMGHQYTKNEDGVYSHRGIGVKHAYYLLSTYGAVREADFPNDDNVIKWCQDKDVLLDALQYRLSGYEIGSFGDTSNLTPINDGIHSSALQDIKAKLQAQKVISFTVKMYNGKYTAYSTWTLQYQGNGYYKILNSRYQMYLGSDGASSITLENNSAEREDYLLWLITKDGFLVPKVNPDYVLSVAGHSAEDVHVILAEATSSSAIQWRIENRT